MNKFTAKEISLIIRSCKDSGVSSFECGGLKLSFEPAGQTIEQIADYGPSDEHIPVSTPEHDLISQKIEEDDDLRELDLQNLMIEDPTAYEKLMRYEQDAGSQRPEQTL